MLSAPPEDVATLETALVDPGSRGCTFIASRSAWLATLPLGLEVGFLFSHEQLFTTLIACACSAPIPDFPKDLGGLQLLLSARMFAWGVLIVIGEFDVLAASRVVRISFRPGHAQL